MRKWLAVACSSVCHSNRDLVLSYLPLSSAIGMQQARDNPASDPNLA